MSRQGIRGGTTRSLDEASDLIELHKARTSQLIESAIWQALKTKSDFHADDLMDVPVPADSLNAIGARVNAMVRRGFMVEIGRRRSANPASNGRKSNVYAITDKGRVELERRGAGVGGVNSEKTPRVRRSAAHPGTDKPDTTPLPRPGGSDTNSQDVAAPENLTLPLGDVPMAQPGRPGHFDDWDMEAA